MTRRTFIVAGIALACMTSAASARTIYGSGAANVIVGTSAADTIYARGGSDTVSARGGNDFVSAGRGADEVHGGGGRDRLYGGPGDDRIYAADGRRDWISCGHGSDRARVDTSDTVSGCEFTDASESPGNFVVSCEFSHRKQVDPIVAPGPPGTLSAHMHDFFGNTSTDSFSTYDSMIAASTTCGLSGDTAGYWAPSLVAPDGTLVRPARADIYYRNRPVHYGTTHAFPADFRLIAGGVGSGKAGWTCSNQSDTAINGWLQTPPACGSHQLKLHVLFPSCWDGTNTDSDNHRSHMAYRPGDDDTSCPASHPVKVPELDLRVWYPVGVGGSDYLLSDGTTTAHADFWNTWNQADLRRLVRDCLRAGIDCKLQKDR